MPRFAFASLPGLLAAVSASAQPIDGPPFRVVGTQPALIADFLQQTHVLNRLVIRSSQFAEERAHSPKVREFARRMVEAHLRIDRDVLLIAPQNGVIVTDAPGTFTSLGALAAHQADDMALRRLGTLSGRRFDLAYLALQEALHRQGVALADSAAQVIKDPGADRMARVLEPILRRHLGDARRLSGELIGDAPSGGPQPVPQAVDGDDDADDGGDEPTGGDGG